MLGQLGERICAWLWGHPSDGVLFALQDGQLSDKRRIQARSHLAKCRRCREKASQMEQEWKIITGTALASGFTSAAAGDELLARIRASIHAASPTAGTLSQQHPASPFAQTEAGRQMAAVLGAYLGRRAAAVLLESGGGEPPSRQDCLVAAGSALTALLGQKGAAAVKAKLHWIINNCADSAVQSSVSAK